MLWVANGRNSPATYSFIQIIANMPFIDEERFLRS